MLNIEYRKSAFPSSPEQFIYDVLYDSKYFHYRFSSVTIVPNDNILDINMSTLQKQ